VLKRFFAGIIVCLVGLMGHPEFVDAMMPLEITVEPNQILMGITYNGLKISVSGDIPADSEALVRMIGRLESPTLKKKGRALGVLWMNLGAVVFHRVPSVFLLYPSKAITEYLRTERERWLRLGLGFEALKEEAEVTPASEDKEALFHEFIRLKQRAGLYGMPEDAVSYGKTEGNMKSFSSTVALPSDLPQGDYKIEAFAIKDGSIVASASEQIKAKEVGLPAILSSLAFDHGALYGILAVLVAIFAGILTGAIFRGGKGAH